MFRPDITAPSIKPTDIPQRLKSRRRKSRVSVELVIA